MAMYGLPLEEEQRSHTKINMMLDVVLDTQEAVHAAASQAVATFSHSPEVFREAWNSSFMRATPHHRLTLLYIVNEILHMEKRNGGGGPLTNYLAMLLPAAVAALFRDRPDAHGKLQRIVSLWRENDILNPSLLNDISRNLSVVVASSPTSPPVISPLPALQEKHTVIETLNLHPIGGGDDDKLPIPSPETIVAPAAARLTNPAECWMLDFPSVENQLQEQEQEVLEDVRVLENQALDLAMGLDPQNRNAVRLYQVLTTRGGGDEQAEAIKLKEGLPNVAMFAQRELEAGQGNEGEEYDRVETVELVTLDCVSMASAVEQRLHKLEEHQDQAEKALVGLVELLAEVETGDGDDEQDSNSEVDALTAKMEFWENMLREKLEPALQEIKRRQEGEQQHKRARTSRWDTEQAAAAAAAAPPSLAAGPWQPGGPLPSLWAAAPPNAATAAPPMMGGLPPPFRTGPQLPPAFLPPGGMPPPILPQPPQGGYYAPQQHHPYGGMQLPQPHHMQIPPRHLQQQQQQHFPRQF